MKTEKNELKEIKYMILNLNFDALPVGDKPSNKLSYLQFKLTQKQNSNEYGNIRNWTFIERKKEKKVF